MPASKRNHVRWRPTKNKPYSIGEPDSELMVRHRLYGLVCRCTECMLVGVMYIYACMCIPSLYRYDIAENRSEDELAPTR